MPALILIRAKSLRQAFMKYLDTQLPYLHDYKEREWKVFVSEMEARGMVIRPVKKGKNANSR